MQQVLLKVLTIKLRGKQRKDRKKRVEEERKRWKKFLSSLRVHSSHGLFISISTLIEQTIGVHIFKIIFKKIKQSKETELDRASKKS